MSLLLAPTLYSYSKRTTATVMLSAEPSRSASRTSSSARVSSSDSPCSAAFALSSLLLLLLLLSSPLLPLPLLAPFPFPFPLPLLPPPPLLPAPSLPSLTALPLSWFALCAARWEKAATASATSCPLRTSHRPSDASTWCYIRDMRKWQEWKGQRSRSFSRLLMHSFMLGAPLELPLSKILSSLESLKK